MTPADDPAANRSEVDRELAALRASFHDRLTERVAAIEAAWTAARDGAPAVESTMPPEETPLRHLFRLVHSLGGSAGTFGFPTVGDAARMLERHLRPRLDASPGDLAPGLAPLLAALRDAVARESP